MFGDKRHIALTPNEQSNCWPSRITSILQLERA